MNSERYYLSRSGLFKHGNEIQSPISSKNIKIIEKYEVRDSLTEPVKPGIPLSIVSNKALVTIPIASPKEIIPMKLSKSEELSKLNKKEEFKEASKERKKSVPHVDKLQTLTQSDETDEYESDFGSTLKDSQALQNKLKELGIQSVGYEEDRLSDDYLNYFFINFVRSPSRGSNKTKR